MKSCCCDHSSLIERCANSSLVVKNLKLLQQILVGILDFMLEFVVSEEHFRDYGLMCFMIFLSVWIPVLALFMRQSALRHLLLRRLYYYTDTLLL
jgi:hypothetical protein